MSEAAVKDTLGAFVPGVQVGIEGAAVGPLRGAEFAAKDIFDIEGFVTGCGNPDWAADQGPARSTAPAVRRLLGAGARLVGKTITDELAFSLNGQNYHFGTPTNVNAPGRIPGGSSSGSATAVAGGLVDLALGSDTGGSIRVPASYCGVYGLRPTHGRINIGGVMPLAASFDTVGCFARSPELLSKAYGALFDRPSDGVAEPRRLLVAEDAFALADPPVGEALQPAVERLQALVGVSEQVDVGGPCGGLEALMLDFRTLQALEIWAQHGAWIERRKPRFGPEIAERFEWAQSIRRDAAPAAQKSRDDLTKRVAGLLGSDNVLCLPTAPGIAPPIGGSAEDSQRHRARALSLTCIAGLTRVPQITLPLASVDGCPVGLSLIAGAGGDEMLLRLAERLEPTDAP